MSEVEYCARCGEIPEKEGLKGKLCRMCRIENRPVDIHPRAKELMAIISEQDAIWKRSHGLK